MFSMVSTTSKGTLLFGLLFLNFLEIFGDKPHIIVIVADDLGWNDVGFHGLLQIPTPNIDALAYSGIILNNYYVQPICTPSRSALMSGLYPYHTGLQHDVIYGAQPYGLPLKLKLLPQYLGDMGYKSHIVGKWHLGMYTERYTPTNRGFQSHFGYWTGHKDYYNNFAEEMPGWFGYDMRRNMTVAWDAYGKYTTDLFTEEAVKLIEMHDSSQPLFLYLAHLAVHSGNPYDPLQAPPEIVEMFSYIEDEHRRHFAGMLWKLDESVGKIIEALNRNGMLNDSFILFTTDNGGPAAGFNDNAASNWPLRGVKASIWEGGIRGAGFVWSPRLFVSGKVLYEMIHITDWLPTFVAAAGGNVSSLENLDGYDVWNVLTEGHMSPRKEILLNIDQILGGAGIRIGDWKLIYNPQGYGDKWDGWFGPSGRNYSVENSLLGVINSVAAKAILKVNPRAYDDIEFVQKSAEVFCSPIPENATKFCNLTENPCLFHIPSDPCEYYDVASQYPQVVSFLLTRLSEYNITAVPPANKPWDPDANPVFWNYAWTNWKDYPKPPGSQGIKVPVY